VTHFWNDDLTAMIGYAWNDDLRAIIGYAWNKYLRAMIGYKNHDSFLEIVTHLWMTI